MIEIVLATANPHKVGEMRDIFSALSPSAMLLGLNDCAGGPFPEPVESGATFEQNSAIKARFYALATRRLCLADDSGLEVDALNGRPGVISSHYCTDGHETGMKRPERDAANNARILRELEGVPPERRTARFVCVLTLCSALGTILARVRGAFEGRIGLPGEVPRGSHGFGYDPLFLAAPSFTQTSAELSSEQKNRISHRRNAAEQMAATVRKM